CIHHFNKDVSRGAVRSGQASGAFSNTARVVLAMAAHDEHDDVRVLEVVKANITKVGQRQSIRIEAVHVDGVTDPVVRSVPAGVAHKTVDELLKAESRPRGGKKASAKEMILAELATGPKTMDHLKAQGVDLGASGDTVWRAANELKGEGLAR